MTLQHARSVARKTQGTVFIIHCPEEFETRRTGFQVATAHEVDGWFNGAWDRVTEAFEDGESI